MILMDEKPSNLEKLKQRYSKIQEKYSLPEFSLLNLDFGIEKISEFETDFLIIDITKTIGEKFSSYLRFIELILNPVNSPLFIFLIVKTLGEDEKKKLSDIYKELTKVELKMIELDIHFSEEKEALFITESYNLWQKIKKDILEVIDKIKSNWDNKSENNSKAYFS